MDKSLSLEIAAACASMQRAHLLFSLIEIAAGEGADLNQAFLLSQIGMELTASAGERAEKVCERGANHA